MHASRFFQESDHLLALDARESLEELLNRITSLQMIEQTLLLRNICYENSIFDFIAMICSIGFAADQPACKTSGKIADEQGWGMQLRWEELRIVSASPIAALL